MGSTCHGAYGLCGGLSSLMALYTCWKLSSSLTACLVQGHGTQHLAGQNSWPASWESFASCAISGGQKCEHFVLCLRDEDEGSHHTSVYSPEILDVMLSPLLQTDTVKEVVVSTAAGRDLFEINTGLKWNLPASFSYQHVQLQRRRWGGWRFVLGVLMGRQRTKAMSREV